MSKGETPLRAVRVDGSLWERAKEIAAAKGDNLSTIIRNALTDYISENEDK